MPYLAMDISKEEIVFYADSLKQCFTVQNSSEALRTFLERTSFHPDDTIVGCEATGDYHRESCLFFLQLGYQVRMLNPILTKQVINATIRKKKTDESDAKIIAKLLADGHGEEVTVEQFHQRKRTMLRTEKKLVECYSDLKRVRKTLEEKGKTMDTADALDAVNHCIAVLEEESKRLTEKTIKEQNRQEEIIDSVPGCGAKLAAIISSEAGEITRFPSASQFKAYVGIDPKVTQSGSKEHTGHMTKRGNPILRYSLFLAANIARQHDPDMKAFYEKKRTEGKSYRHAVCAVSRKLCERIYAIVSKNEFYKVKEFS